MNTKTLIIAVALLLVGGAAAQTTAPTTKLETTPLTTDPVPVQSGEDADITFKITNKGSTEASDVEATILDRYPFRLKPDRKRNYSLGTVEPGETYYISTEVLVAEDAPDGSNNLHVRLADGEFSREAEIPVEVQSRDIELNIANLQTQPTSLRPDTDDNRMTVEVVNNGEKTAENVVLELSLPDFFEETSSFSYRQALGNVAPGQVKPATFTFDINETAPAGMATIPSTISYSTGDNTATLTREKSFDVFLEGRPQFRVTDHSADLQTGSEGELRVTVKNVGDAKSSSTRIRVLDSSDLPFTYGSSSQFIGTLEPGATGTAVFDITTEQGAAAKNYLLDFELRGVKDTEVFVGDTTLDLQVREGSRSPGLDLPLIAALAALVAVLAYVFRNRLGEVIPL